MHVGLFMNVQISDCFQNFFIIIFAINCQRCFFFLSEDSVSNLYPCRNLLHTAGCSGMLLV